jgi:hypothetical protein
MELGQKHRWTRRELLASTAGAAAALSISPHRAFAAAAGGMMAERAARVLAELDDERRQAASFPFESSTRQRWNFMGPWTKPGIPLEKLTSAQRLAVLDLLSVALSPDGMRKAEKIMVLQDVLRDLGDGPRDRNRDRFSIAFFGTPGAGRLWGWRFEGHHLSLSFTLLGDRVVSVTPSSFSSNPNVVDSGKHRGLVALDGEVALARSLYADLDAKNRARALINDRAFGNILTTAGRETRIGTRQGVPLSELSQSQRGLFMRLVETYAVDHLAMDLAAIQRKRIRDGDLMAAHFAWAGSDRDGETMYYRLHGKTFLIEFASLPNQPLHLHTVRHDLEWNLGAHVAA